jgi:cyclopropane fatty-acyl-phospholipid synthase-like methyltransferase
MNLDQEWFRHWFDSPYYSKLYKKHDIREASVFLDHLLENLEIKPNSRLLDLPCGEGRHSIYLHELGFNVTGADINEKCIQKAKTFEKPGLKFLIHDMRNSIKESSFDLILNLYTSFGYFETKEEDLKTLRSINFGLRDSGWFVLDFINMRKALKSLNETEKKAVDKITFNIQKIVKGNFLVKWIHIRDGDKEEKFYERLKILMPENFQEYFKTSNFTVDGTYGDYNFSPFNPESSNRLIYILRKS